MSANLELLCASSPLDDEEDLPAADVRESEEPSLRRPGFWTRLAASVLAPRPGFDTGVDRVEANLRCA